MQVEQLAPGLWQWTSRHPDWTPEQGGPEGWDPDVGSVYAEAYGDVLLIDPLVPADEAREHPLLGGARPRRRASGHAAGAAHLCLARAQLGRGLARYAGARLWSAPAWTTPRCRGGSVPPGRSAAGSGGGDRATIPRGVVLAAFPQRTRRRRHAARRRTAFGCAPTPGSAARTRETYGRLPSEPAGRPSNPSVSSSAHGDPVTTGGGVALQRALVAA